MESNISEVLLNCESRMRKAILALRRDLIGIRTGRATPSLIENIKVDYHGVPTPLNQVASISVPDPRMLLVSPWDPSILGTIEKTILKSELGLNPQNDSHVIRVPIPPLTEERRRDFVKLARKSAEEGRIALRNIRRDSIEELRMLEKEKKISQDENKRTTEQIQKILDSFVAEVNTVAGQKEKEIMEV